jgi:hypothetical protein
MLLLQIKSGTAVRLPLVAGAVIEVITDVGVLEFFQLKSDLILDIVERRSSLKRRRKKIPINKCERNDSVLDN